MMTIEMLANFADYAEITTIFAGTAREQSWIQVHDFEGFDENWDEIMIDLPEEIFPVLDELAEQGWDIRYDSEDI
jgi:hypothetical protein